MMYVNNDGLNTSNAAPSWKQRAEPADADETIRVLREERDRLMRALQFYADPKNWRDTPSWDGDPDCITPKAVPVQAWDNNACDCGEVARAATQEPTP